MKLTPKKAGKASRRVMAAALVALSLPALTGCIDDKYDLSDVDTTVRVNVDNLTVPVNIDAVTLRSIFDLKSDSKVKEVDGAYAYVDNGDLHSSGIRVSPIHLPAPYVAPTTATVNIPDNPFGSSRKGRRYASSLKVDFTGPGTTFTAEADNVSTSISGIERVGGSISLIIKISLPQLQGNLRTLRLSNIRFNIPRGLTLSNTPGQYDPKTGVLTIPSLSANGNAVSLTLTATAIDASYTDLKFNEAAHHLSFSDRLALASATLTINPSDLSTLSLPKTLSVRTDFTISDIDITTFSGLINYDIEDFNVNDVNITGLPDVLSQPGTDLRLVNPQIYFSISNPLSSLGLTAQSGMAITSYAADGQKVGVYSPDAPFFTIGCSATNNYVMSPAMPSPVYPGFGTPEHIAYASLGNVLSGNGIPARLSVAFNDTRVPRQQVKDFRLGYDYGNVQGRYTIVAPLEFANGSKLLYTDALDGWSSEDLDAVTIETLTVNAIVSTDLPVNLQLTGYPIDKEGRQINNVQIEGATVNAGAQNQQIAIRITGQIRNLDGIRFTALVTPGQQTAPLAPNMNITLTNIRPVVSGYYQKEL